MKQKRVVVTGLGAVSSIGIGVDAYWRNLMAGVSGIKLMTDIYESSRDKKYAEHFSFLENSSNKYKAKCLGLVTELDIFSSDLETLAAHYGYKHKINIQASEWKKIGLYSKFAVGAGLEALLDSGILSEEGIINANADRVGVYLGNTIGGQDVSDACVFRYKEHEFKTSNNIDSARTLSQYGAMYVISTISNLCTSYISMAFGLKGVAAVQNAACASSNIAIANAADYIRSGRADVMVCGGSDRCSSLSSIAGFDAMTALSRWQGDPAQACRPYDVDRNGFIFSDGAGILVLEELEHARARQKRAIAEGKPVPVIYCEYIDHGMSSDAGHISRPSPEGVMRAMRDAIKYAGIMPHDITYATTHGTSTPAGDQCELQSIEAVLNGGLDDQSASSCHNDNIDYTHQKSEQDINCTPFQRCTISAIKSSIGHTLGAAAGMQNVALAKSLHESVAPPILNLDSAKSINPNARYSLVGKPETQKITPGYAMSNSFGFGGINTVTIWRPYNEKSCE
jgi:3-oxoacyl-[acyl-carrier-protein] synthase II